MRNSTRVISLSMICLLMTCILSHALFAQAPAPMIKLRFNESSGTTVNNTGTVPTTLSRSAPTPAISTNVPAIAGGTNSIDFATTPGNYFVQSADVVNALKNLPAFTLTGWINTRSSAAGAGGNRIISWINHGGDGVDLVYQSNGSLRLGVDEWPDFTPAFSSANKVLANAAAPNSNWIFFAVTYHNNGQVQFYFGNNSTDATLDVTRIYPGRGLTGSNIGKLAIGAFNDATRNTSTYDRMFRGLIDDIRIHNSVLTSQDIVAVQREIIDTTPPPAPTLLTVQSVTTSSVTLQWQVPQDQSDIVVYLITGNVGGAQFSGSSTLTPFNFPGLNANTTYTFFVQSKDRAGNLSSQSNIVTVTTLETDPDTTPPTVPEGLFITGKTATTVSMQWLPSTDDVGVTQYNIHSGFGAPIIAQVQGTTTTLTNLIPATWYTMRVSAVDAAGNVSGLGDPVGFTTNAASGASTDPLLDLGFNETSGVTVSYSGTAIGSFTRSAGAPASSTIAPAGVGFGNSFDFGTTPGNFYVQSAAPIDALKNLDAFTLTGWLNCKSNVTGQGGNRIISWINNGGEGVDLVYQSDGSLRLGIDGWPDFSPAFSSANKVPANAGAPASNWVFFAVSYQSNGQVQFYFGNNTTNATLDVTKSYPGPGSTGSNIGKLAIGAFNDATRNPSTYNRMFRGLIDKVGVYGFAMNTSQVIAIQKGRSFDGIPPTAPQNLQVVAKTTTSVTLQTDGSFDNQEVASYILYQNDAVFRDPLVGVVTGLTPSTTYSFSLKARDVVGNISAASNTVTVTTDPSLTPLVDIRFAQTGAVETNYGSLGGQFAGGTGRSSNVPVSGSPYSSTSQITSGVPLEGLKNLEKFTITGWINKTTTSGENRIIGWQPMNGGEGVELMVSSDGTFSLGVDQQPQFGTFSSVNKISVDPNASAANWVFFAVTYTPGTAKFYFGNNIVDATLDLARYYDMGPAGSDISYMYIRPEDAGLLDEVRVYNAVLSLQDIIAVQGTLPDTTPPTAPAGLSVNSVGMTSVGLHWTTASTDNIGVVSYDVFNGPTLLKVHVPQPSLPSSLNNTTVTGLTPGTAYTLTLKAKDNKGNYSPASNAVAVTTSGSLPGTPLIWLKLDESNNTLSAINSGTAPPVYFSRSQIPKNPVFPASVTNVPVNVGGLYAADFGTIPRNTYIESNEQIDALRNLSAFTLAGWVNNASNVTGSGGNRIISWINNGGDGVDLVYQNDGRLRLGVDAWPDFSPAFSSLNKVTTNAALPASNWIFFAVTYQSNGQVQFYFGSNTVDAALDATRTYSAPGVTGNAIGTLAIGAFNFATRNPSTYDRMFRGLIDNIQIYNSVLTAQQIATIQRVNPESVNNARLAMPKRTKETQAKSKAMFEQSEMRFDQNYPNPFTTSTQIDMYIPSSVNAARVVVIDVNGRLFNKIEVPGRGRTSVTIESTNMSSGIYFYSLVVDGKVVGTKRMAVIK